MELQRETHRDPHRNPCRGVRMASRALLLCAVAVAAGSCAHAPHRRAAVNIERRPTPIQPDSSGVPVARDRPRVMVMTPQTLHSTIATIAEDTLAARQALGRCGTRKLLPDQEGVFDSSTRLLMQVREALASVDFTRALSLARQARQTASSIGCR